MKSLRIRKSLRIVLSVVAVLATVVLALGITVAFRMPPAAVSSPDAEKAFQKLQTLVGTWDSDDPKEPLTVKFRVTSNGSAILSEMEAPPDNMVTMYHLDNGRLLMTHYCAAGNQPRMVGKISPDGKTISFDFLDGTNINRDQDGHMHRFVITVADANHHSEDFIYQPKWEPMLVPVHANLHRTQ